ncbi:hypothetical protein C8R45DRAFT_1016628 [Mycena sanguinolenta]|nr:hypothetical protein C8R45DRAFT_1016628 [Mycena sanguinolenta]
MLLSLALCSLPRHMYSSSTQSSWPVYGCISTMLDYLVPQLLSAGTTDVFSAMCQCGSGHRCCRTAMRSADISPL